MEEDKLKYVKTVVRSVLTSTKGNITISQLLVDYRDMEGTDLPYKILGFKTIYELLKAIDDVVKIPSNPSMNSPVEVIISTKTAHVRELVQIQKSKKNVNRCTRKQMSKVKSYKSYSPNKNTVHINNYASKKFKAPDYHDSTNYNVRGYDNVMIKSSTLPTSEGYVTDELRTCIENLCAESNRTSVNALKNCLLTHPDYAKLKKTNLEECINMLKYFIYIDKGGVHLKNSPYNIYPGKNLEVKKDIKPKNEGCTYGFIDENEELEFSFDNMYDDFDFSDNVNDELASVANPKSLQLSCKINALNKPLIRKMDVMDQKQNNQLLKPTTLEANELLHKNVRSKIELKPPRDEKSISNSLDYDKYSKNSVEQLEKKYKKSSDDKVDYKKMIISIILKSKNKITVKQVLNKFKIIHGYSFPFEKLSCKTSLDFFRLHPTVFKLENEYSTNSVVQLEEEENKSALFELENEYSTNRVVQLEEKKNKSELLKLENDYSTNNVVQFEEEKYKSIDDNIDYKKLIISIISKSNKQMTVKQVLDKFKYMYGYDFPFENFSCRTCMDFFRLYPTIFKLEDYYSTNSVIELGEEKRIHKRKTTIRHLLPKTSLNHNSTAENLKKLALIQNEYASEDSFQNSNEPLNDHIDPIDNSQSIPGSTIVESYEIYDSDMVLDSMKTKMKNLLTKHKNGIPCDEFMDVYADEYQSRYDFTEYGFTSMRDMAYKLPSVFYVHVSEENNECVLYHSQQRSELENNNNNDPSLYYKNIPQTVLHNLSIFFKKYSGINFDNLLTNYCSEFGLPYEPLKYGYSSERHMFESLNKMVEIRNNRLFTLDPLAYTYFIQYDDLMYLNKKNVLPVTNNFLLNYSGSDVCNAKFSYSTLNLNEKKTRIVVAEIYNPGSFYVHLESEVVNLNRLMNNLQELYNKNEIKYTVKSEFITLGMACVSRFEDTMQWHRAKVQKIVDKDFVILLYVDYGSIEIVSKSSIRLLDLNFCKMPRQAIHCKLHGSDKFKHFSRDASEMFSELICDKTLDAVFHKRKRIEIDGDDEKKSITLYMETGNLRININEHCFSEIKTVASERYPGTIRRNIALLAKS